MLSTPVALVGEVGAVGVLAYSVAWVKQHLSDRKVVLMAVIGALIFALQMLNFPIAGGTSGHFSGGALAAITLGLWPASIVLAAVLGIQALVFFDGGILAFGANVINMGLVSPLVGYAVYRAFIAVRDTKTSRVAGAFVGSWLAVVASSAVAGLEIWASGRANLAVVLGSMVGWHALIGIGEGLITGALVAYLVSVRPDLLDDTKDKVRSSMKSVYVVLGVLAVIGAGLSWLASSHPDGLEYVYFESGIGKPFAELSLLGKGSIFADYGIRGLPNEAIGTVLAGIVGLVLVGALLWILLAPKKDAQLEGVEHE
jgi:cobalt/nickel transport system permease protein